MRSLIRPLLVATLLVTGVLAYTPDRAAADVDSAFVTDSSRFIGVDGMRVHYVDEGHGPTIVLVHGSNDSLFAWEGWMRELSDEYRIVAMDLPGHGLTGPDPKARYRYEDQAQFVRSFADALGLKRFAVGGNSMGGSVAWHFALAYPDRTEALILVDAVGLPRDEPRPLMFEAFEWPGIDRVMTVVTPRFSVESALRDAYGDPSRVTDEQVRRYHELLLREGNREATRMRLQMQPDSDELVPQLSALEEPTLILWGGADDWVLPKYGERYADLIPSSRLIVYGGLGHLPMTEDPGATASDVDAFLGAALGGS